jgi:hypothetical protein
MSTIHRITELGPATARRQVYSPLETYWKCISGVAQTREAAEPVGSPDGQRAYGHGITRGEIDYVTSKRSIDPTGFRSS